MAACPAEAAGEAPCGKPCQSASSSWLSRDPCCSTLGPMLATSGSSAGYEVSPEPWQPFLHVLLVSHAVAEADQGLCASPATGICVVLTRQRE